MFRIDFPSFTYRRMRKGFRLIGFYNIDRSSCHDMMLKESKIRFNRIKLNFNMYTMFLIFRLYYQTVHFFLIFKAK